MGIESQARDKNDLQALSNEKAREDKALADQIAADFGDLEADILTKKEDPIQRSELLAQGPRRRETPQMVRENLRSYERERRRMVDQARRQFEGVDPKLARDRRRSPFEAFPTRGYFGYAPAVEILVDNLLGRHQQGETIMERLEDHAFLQREGQIAFQHVEALERACTRVGIDPRRTVLVQEKKILEDITPAIFAPQMAREQYRQQQGGRLDLSPFGKAHEQFLKTGESSPLPHLESGQWDASSEGREAFEAKVKRFLNRLYDPGRFVVSVDLPEDFRARSFPVGRGRGVTLNNATKLRLTDIRYDPEHRQEARLVFHLEEGNEEDTFSVPLSAFYEEYLETVRYTVIDYQALLDPKRRMEAAPPPPEAPLVPQGDEIPRDRWEDFLETYDPKDGEAMIQFVNTDGTPTWKASPYPYEGKNKYRKVEIPKDNFYTLEALADRGDKVVFRGLDAQGNEIRAYFRKYLFKKYVGSLRMRN